jgi:preprotein translocase subunit SecA
MNKFKSLANAFKMQKYKDIAKKAEKIFVYADNADIEKVIQKHKELKTRISGDSHALTEDDIIAASNLIKSIVHIKLGIKLFVHQVVAGIAMNDGYVIEMGTGEGKTLASAITIYLSFLQNKNIHIITANDYLVKRDAKLIGGLFKNIGINVSLITEEMDLLNRAINIKSDVVYSTMDTIKFSYIYSNYQNSVDGYVNNKFERILVDEADLIMIDQAGQSSSISSSVKTGNTDYKIYLDIIKFFEVTFSTEDFSNDERYDIFVDKKSKVIEMSKNSFKILESFGVNNNLIKNESDLYQKENIKILNCFMTVCKAVYTFEKDVDYIVSDGLIVPIDSSSGRLSHGSKFLNGIHEAVCAKEGLSQTSETLTGGRINTVAFLNKYDEVFGMSGTAMSEDVDFRNIYGIKTIKVDPDSKNKRKEHGTFVFASKEKKYSKIIKDVNKQHKKGRPIIIGTSSVDKSNDVSALLDKNQIEHVTLNAENHHKESEIIKNAGQKGKVTIVTDMAGRGTDVILGGDLEDKINLVKSEGGNEADAIEQWKADNEYINSIGGIHIIAAEHFPTQRNDRQLIGRCARQGDEGSCVFYTSTDDRLFFSGDKTPATFQKLMALLIKSSDGEQNNMLNKAISNIQKSIEGHQHSMREHSISYDYPINNQMEIFYSIKNKIRFSNDLSSIIKYSLDFLEKNTDKNILDDLIHVLDVDLEDFIPSLLGKIDKISSEELYIVKARTMSSLNDLWSNHINNMDILKKSIMGRQIAKNSLLEFKRESKNLFDDFLIKIFQDILTSITVSITTDIRKPISNLDDSSYRDIGEFYSRYYQLAIS